MVLYRGYTSDSYGTEVNQEVGSRAFDRVCSDNLGGDSVIQNTYILSIFSTRVVLVL